MAAKEPSAKFRRALEAEAAQAPPRLLPVAAMRPRPRGGHAHDLLETLLNAFGRNTTGGGSPPPSERTARRAVFPAEADPSARLARWTREIHEAAPILQELVARVAKLQRSPLPRPRDYAREWASIIEVWNREIYEREWLDLPPLCESCGRPVFRRPSERMASRNYDLSTVCSEPCRLRRKSRRSAAKHRQK
ncbi:MAG: hypothetical protein WCE40_08205 [Polyangia bacterium]